MYNSISELLQEAEQKKQPLWSIILKNEIELTDKNEMDIFDELEARYEVMLNSAFKGIYHPERTRGTMIGGLAKAQWDYSENNATLCGSFINQAMAMALSCSEVNACMGKICAAPTAGSCGILPAVMASTAKRRHLSQKEILKGLLTASGLGAIVVKNATVAGAEGGCQAECGVAAAMAAAGAVEMCKGSPKMAINAFSLALSNCMGLVCDPIAGLVQIPCAQRNASQTINALISADMAMSGMEFIIPPDQVVEAMYKVGKQLPLELKETALGGIASTPKAKEIERILLSGDK